MACVVKFTEHAVVNQLRHNARTIENSSNNDINPDLISNNYFLSPDRETSFYDYFKKRKSELYCYGRADVKVMAGWIVTAPKELPQNMHPNFFQSTYNFLADRYGENNVIQAVVHGDESGQPHLHFCFIPVVPDKKHGGEKICANDVLNKQELRNFHPDLQRFLKKNGIDANISSGITRERGGNRTVNELKRGRTVEFDRNIERGRW